MSAETARAIDEAISAHVAEESAGGYTMGWVLVAASAISDDSESTAYWYKTSGAPIHHTLGLLDIGREHYHAFLMEDE